MTGRACTRRSSASRRSSERSRCSDTRCSYRSDGMSQHVRSDMPMNPDAHESAMEKGQPTPGSLKTRSLCNTVLVAAQGEVKGQEALRVTAAEEKAAAMRRCAKAELDLQEAQQRITSTAATQVRLPSLKAATWT